jgi:hypothetical protein
MPVSIYRIEYLLLTKYNPVKIKLKPRIDFSSTVSWRNIHPKIKATIGIMRLEAEMMTASFSLIRKVYKLNPNADAHTDM